MEELSVLFLRGKMSEWISVKEIPLTRGLFAKVDEEDFDWLIKFSWQAHERHDKRCFYATSRGGIRMHRLIMDCPEDFIVDHINGNGLDNRKCNLRIGSQSLNSVNRKQTPGPYLRGARKKKNRWQAYIKIHGVQESIGYFGNEQEAHQAYLKRANDLYGHWMPLPFIEGVKNE